ncbi:MAG: hypothetical protein SGI90_05405 [Candidatus Eisenbacteria bacterium]|nr:hypothetical protein [Candidatus Eisenbacteria bacterium]
MRIAELEDLIRVSLNSLGAEETGREGGIVHFRLDESLAARFGREGLSLTFRPAVAAHHPEVDLVSAGSFLYDLILRLVREHGRAASGWLPVDESIQPEERIHKSVPRLAGRALTKVKSSWGTIYLFTFRLGFYSDLPQERLYTVRVDWESTKVRHDVHPWRLVDAAGPSPAGAPATPDGIEPEKAFRMAWVKVEEEVARLTDKQNRQVQERLLGEIETIETYYRQLIDEEKLFREQRVTRKGREESDSKIEMLKLDWDRRVMEEKRRLLPEVKVSLSCALKLRTPLDRWRARTPPGRREPMVDYWIDRHSGEVWTIRRRKRAAGPRRLKGTDECGILVRPSDVVIGVPENHEPEESPA